MKLGQKHTPEAHANFIRGWEKRRASLPTFWEKVEKTDSCWLWRYSVRGNGYGQATLNGRSGSAHRMAYELVKGPIPPGLTIDHLCRNRRCVNPDHLEAVTMAENIRRGTAPTARNARKTHCIRGHPLSGDNLRMGTKDGGPWRICIACRTADTARSNARQAQRLRDDPAYRDRINARRRARRSA